MHVCMHACMRVCVHAYRRVCVHARVECNVFMHVRVCVRTSALSVCNVCDVLCAMDA